IPDATITAVVATSLDIADTPGPVSPMVDVLGDEHRHWHPYLPNLALHQTAVGRRSGNACVKKDVFVGTDVSDLSSPPKRPLTRQWIIGIMHQVQRCRVPGLLTARRSVGIVHIEAG